MPLELVKIVAPVNVGDDFTIEAGADLPVDNRSAHSVEELLGRVVIGASQLPVDTVLDVETPGDHHVTISLQEGAPLVQPVSAPH